MKSFSKPAPKKIVAFDELVRSLVDDKYNREYKLDKKTRAKALEILTDYFAKHQDEATNVSLNLRSRLASGMLVLNQFSARITGP
mmetsp:Transcript_47632/g.62961  ORF Transcript_47632/g.62961 Transcript_47632/m.62961 type:complete len:85 (+) Transcript_47632:397-651(+)